MPLKMPRTSTALRSRVARSAVLACIVLGAGMSAGSADDQNPDRVPFQSELPTYPVTGGWVPSRGTGLNYATSAKQWIRLPPLFMSAYNRASTTLIDNRCPGGRLYPYQSSTKRSAALHFQSSPGTPSHYGYVGPFTVRTVAFGSIPVEAQIQLRQRRDAQDKPIGLELSTIEEVFCPGVGPHSEGTNEETTYVHGSVVSGELEVAVAQLRVDGIDLHLRGSCQTEKPAAVSFSGADYYSLDLAARVYLDAAPGTPPLPADQAPRAANLMRTPVFNVGVGGLLTGNVDIPAFSGCLTTSGEDVSRLLTTTVSGPDNRAITRAEGIDATETPRTEPLPALPFPTTAP